MVLHTTTAMHDMTTHTPLLRSTRGNCSSDPCQIVRTVNFGEGTPRPSPCTYHLHLGDRVERYRSSLIEHTLGTKRLPTYLLWDGRSNCKQQPLRFSTYARPAPRGLSDNKTRPPPRLHATPTRYRGYMYTCHKWQLPDFVPL